MFFKFTGTKTSLHAIADWHFHHPFSIFQYHPYTPLGYHLCYAPLHGLPCWSTADYNGEKLCPDQIKTNILTPLTLKHKTVDLSKIAFTPDYLINKGYDGIKIFIGTGATPPSNQYGIIPNTYNTKINDSGIILCVGNLKLRFNRIILPSDVSYYNWPDAPELKLDFYLSRLLVPHHGGSVYAASSFNNSAPYKHIPITDCHKRPTIDTCHIDFLQKGMHMASSKFYYTDSLSTRPYYQTKIIPY